MPDQLTVTPVEIIQPLVLASPGFLATLQGVEEAVAALTITDAASAQQAADIQSRLTKAAKTLDDQRKALNKPFDDQITAINAAAKGPAGRIQAAKDTVSRALTVFAVEQQRIAREAERARQIELARLQEIERKEQARLKQLAEAEKRCAEEAAKNRAEFALDDWDNPPESVTASVVVEPTETQKAIAAIAAPVVAVARPSGVTIRTTLKAIVEDITKVPDIFIDRAIKMRAIESTFCVRWSEDKPVPVCPGIRFEIDRKTVTTR